MDLRIAEWCQEHAFNHPWALQLARTMTEFGSLATIAAVTGLAVFLLAMMGNKNAAILWLAVVGSGVAIDQAVKYAVHRPRPPIWMQDPSVLQEDYSFPSGHTLAITVTGLAFVTALSGLYCKPWQKALALVIVCVLIFGVGISRFYLRAHWFSDVVSAWLIGAAWFIVCAGFQQKVESET